MPPLSDPAIPLPLGVRAAAQEAAEDGKLEHDAEEVLQERCFSHRSKWDGPGII